jgi:ribosome maturation factor RimP
MAWAWPTLLFETRAEGEEVSAVSAASRVRHVVEPLLTGQGIEVVDVELTGSTLRVVVDREGGIDLEGVAYATQSVSAALDSDESLDGPYVLEVSSPGVERPLRVPEHYRRAVGSTVTVKTLPGVQGERRHDGVLDAADDTGIVVDGQAIAYDDIERARTTFSWGPAPRPGRGPKTKAKTKQRTG